MGLKAFAAGVIASLGLLAPASAQYTPDWICEPGQVTEVATGTVTQTGAQGELDFAIERSDPLGAFIEVRGTVNNVQLGIGENYRNFQVVRQEPIRVTIFGQDWSNPVIEGGIQWGGKKEPGGVLPGFAVEYLELYNLTADGSGVQNPLAGFMDTSFGDIVFDQVTLLSDPTTKWGSRIHGQARSILIRNCVFNGGGEEHAFYIDHPQDFLKFEGNTAYGWKRTMLQVVTRETPGSPGINPPAATGNLVIQDNSAFQCGAHGAFNFTVTGWPNGTVSFRRNTGISDWGTGMFVCYYDSKQGQPGNGLFTPNGYQVGKLVIKDNVTDMRYNDRECYGLGRIEEVIVKYSNRTLFSLVSNKAAFDLKKNGWPNGSIELWSRDDPNTWNLNCNVFPWKMDTAFMTPAQVTALWIPQ